MFRTFACFRNEDYLYGSLTLVITLWPMMLYILVNLITYGFDRKYWHKNKFYFLVPLVQANNDWDFLKDLAQLINENKSTDAKKSEMAEYSFYQSIGESAPQFILQVSILLYENESFSGGFWTYWLYMKIGISAFSLIWGLCNSYLCLPTFSEDGQRIIPYQTMKNLLVVLPSMVFVAIPKFIILILIFGTIRDYAFVGFVLAGLVAYFGIYLGFTLNEYCKVKREIQNAEM